MKNFLLKITKLAVRTEIQFQTENTSQLHHFMYENIEQLYLGDFKNMYNSKSI
jgi:hypothetical protein